MSELELPQLAILLEEFTAEHDAEVVIKRLPQDDRVPWTVGIHWDFEPRSPVFGSAAYGLGKTLGEALDEALADVRRLAKERLARLSS